MVESAVCCCDESSPTFGGRLDSRELIWAARTIDGGSPHSDTKIFNGGSSRCQ